MSTSPRSAMRLFALLVLAAISFELWKIRARATRLVPPSEPVPLSFFGLHIHHLPQPTPWPRVSFGSWRLWDAYVVWPNVEPQKGQWDFSHLDGYISLAESHSVEILLPLGLTPAWASSRPKEKSGYEPGNAAEPRNISDWSEYVRSEEHTSELQSRLHLVCRLLLEKKKIRLFH